MKIHTKIQRWGNGLALRVSGAMRDIPRFRAGTEVEVEIHDNGFTVRERKPESYVSLPFSEEELLEGLTWESAHGDALAEPLPDETGEDW